MGPDDEGFHYVDGLSNVVAISASPYGQDMALRRDGTVAILSPSLTSQGYIVRHDKVLTTDVRDGVAIAAGAQGLVLHRDGTVSVVSGQNTSVPNGLNDVIAI